MKTVFSIIIPVYNVEGYLRKCLDSLVAQTCADWEAVCVDDGSTDGSGAILDTYAAKDPRFKVLHQANAGVAAARNRAIDVSTGAWVMFLDADDVLRENCVADVQRTIDRWPEADAVHFGLMRFSDGDACKWSADAFSPQLHVYKDVTPEIFHQDGFVCKVFSRRLIGDVRFSPRQWGEDRLFLVTCMAKANAVAELGETCYGYRQRLGSAMHSPITAAKLRDELWLLDEYRLWHGCGRKYPRIWWRKLAQYLTEFYAQKFFSCENDVRTTVWPSWKAALCEVRSAPEFPVYNRFVLNLFAALPCQASAWLLFYVPQFLKTKGLHR